MVSAIADILKSKLDNLPWIERFAGLVTPVQRPVFTQGADGVQVLTGYQIAPVACDVNAANCWENGLYKMLEPDSAKTAVAFFVDNGGSTLRNIEGPKNARLKMTFDLKFLCWMNLERLGTEFTNGRCDAAGRVAPYVMAQFWGNNHLAFGKFGGGVEEDIFQEINVDGIRQLQKNPSVFAPFTFATDPKRQALFMYPYDYFAIQVSGTFILNVNCLPGLIMVQDDAYCIPQ